MDALHIGLLGCGVVGGGLLSLLQENGEVLTRRLGQPLQVRRVLVRNLRRQRNLPLPPGVLTTDFEEVLADPRISIVVELMGGTEVARKYALRALRAGKHLVTANKALLALHATELLAEAEARHCMVGFEASVGGGIPILEALATLLAANRIESLHGIINGTTNYILGRMAHDHLPYAAALAAAQGLGYAEPDPTLDVDGTDSAHKIAILARLAFGVDIDFKEISVQGITEVGPDDLRVAARFGYALKLLASATYAEEQLHLSVRPALVPQTAALASIEGPYNAVQIIGNFCGPQLFVGQGAGPRATASAVACDILAIGARLMELAEYPSRRWLGAGAVQQTLARAQAKVSVAPRGAQRGRYLLLVPSGDPPGSAGTAAAGRRFEAGVAEILSRHGIAAPHTEWVAAAAAGEWCYALETEPVVERQVWAGLDALATLESVKAAAKAYRIEPLAVSQTKGSPP